MIQRPQGAGRPCYEAEKSACRGEWRREAVPILVVVASIQMRFLKTEVENGSMTTAFDHGLVGPKS